MISRPLAIKDPKNICFKCLQKKDSINKYYISDRGYGSLFDNIDTQLNLCNDCCNLIKEEWFNELPNLIDYYCEEYKYEKNILEFIETLPLEGQELFWARFAYGANADCISGQDWIDEKLEILPEWKYKKYMKYAPYRLKIAKERFELCNEPVNRIWDDNSKGCWCPFGATGKYGQKAGYDTGEECYECDQFCKRYEPIKEMTDKEYRHYEKIRRAKVLLERENKDIEDY